MKSILAFVLISLATTSAFAKDPRNNAVKRSPFIRAALAGLKSEQGLACQMTQDESGEETITYVVAAPGFTTFTALYVCDSGKSAVFTGSLSDHGRTAVQKFELGYFN